MRCAQTSVTGSRSSKRPSGDTRTSRRTLAREKAAISAASAPPAEIPTRSAPSRPDASRRSRVAVTQSARSSRASWPRPPGKPGSEGTITRRRSASASRNGDQRGNPTRPPRTPSFSPRPASHTRQGRPFTSTVRSEGVLTAPPRSASRALRGAAGAATSDPPTRRRRSRGSGGGRASRRARCCGASCRGPCCRTGAAA